MSQITKLDYITSKLGAAVANGQQTTRVIYDTSPVIVVPGLAPYPKYYELFTGGTNKTINETNLPTGKLDSGEAMVIKEVQIHTFQTGLAQWASQIGLLNIFVGNQCVLKDFNPGTQWGTSCGPYERIFSSLSGSTAGIRLLTDIVLPPQVDVKVTLQFPSDSLAYNGQNQPNEIQLQVRLLGYGVLFNAGTSF